MSSKNSSQITNESAMLKAALIPTVIVGIACLALFAFFKGINGFYGALVAQFVVVVFFLVHLLVSKLSRNIDPMATMALALFSYVTKLTVIGSFLIILDKFTPEETIDRNSFGISAIALTAAWLGGEIKGYLSLKTHLPLPPKQKDETSTEESQ
jgi:ATP synthase protein I